jgi:hypothetical protein
MEIIEFNGWKNCIRLENLLVDLVITTDIGPRVIRYGYLDEENEFQEAPEDQGKTGGSQWRPYGGHRLWHAPELAGRTTLPDNDSVAYEDHGDFVRVIQKTEALTGIQKEMDIRLSPVDTHVRVTTAAQLRRLGCPSGALGADRYGPWRDGDFTAAAARIPSAGPAAGQSAGAVGLYGPERPALDLGTPVHSGAPGSAG